MKGKISAFIELIVLIFLCTSGLIEPITKVFVWLITIDNNSPDISVFGQLVVKYGTWIIAYSLVRALFKLLNWFNSTAMKIVYFIINNFILIILVNNGIRKLFIDNCYCNRNSTSYWIRSCNYSTNL